MKLLKLSLPVIMLTVIVCLNGTSHIPWAEAQASTPLTDSVPARDIPTYREDITLTNNCIDGGKEKIYCLCMTKIFKNEMTLRQYRGAVALYGQQNTQLSLSEQGYSAAEVSSINSLRQKLSSEDKFRTRCEIAETYFSAATES